MSNQIYQDIQNNSAQGQFQEFMSNPFSFLMRKNINIPSEFQSNPQSAVQYLLNNGQMNQGAFNKVYSILQKMGMRF